MQAPDEPLGRHAQERGGGRGESLHPVRGTAGSPGVRLRGVRRLQEGKTRSRQNWGMLGYTDGTAFGHPMGPTHLGSIARYCLALTLEVETLKGS